jgi:hypothetical protein
LLGTSGLPGGDYNVAVFWKATPPVFFRTSLKKEAVSFSEMLTHFYQAKQRHIPKDSKL